MIRIQDYYCNAICTKQQWRGRQAGRKTSHPVRCNQRLSKQGTRVLYRKAFDPLVRLSTE